MVRLVPIGPEILVAWAGVPEVPASSFSHAMAWPLLRSPYVLAGLSQEVFTVHAEEGAQLLLGSPSRYGGRSSASSVL